MNRHKEPELYNVMLMGNSKAIRALRCLAMQAKVNKDDAIDYLLDVVLGDALQDKRKYGKMLEAVRKGKQRRKAWIDRRERKSQQTKDEMFALEHALGMQRNPVRIVIPSDSHRTIRLIPAHLAGRHLPDSPRKPKTLKKAA